MAIKHIGSRFDDFLADEAMLEQATAVAIKRVIAWQIAQEMQAQQLTKTALAKKMRTSRAALNRLLDENDASLTLTTLASAAAALGKKDRPSPFDLAGRLAAQRPRTPITNQGVATGRRHRGCRQPRIGA